MQRDSSSREDAPSRMEPRTLWFGADVWADISRVHAEFTTFQIDLGEFQADSGTISPIARIRMPPQAAKMLSEELCSAVTAWEEHYGKIDLEGAGQLLTNNNTDENGERPDEEHIGEPAMVR